MISALSNILIPIGALSGVGISLLAGTELFPTQRRFAAPALSLERKFSVIIPARNEERNLPRLLDSLKEAKAELHSHSGARLEVIVVDDGSTDATVRLARERGAHVVTSSALSQGWTGKAWACQQGATAASGEILIFLDADTWFERGGFAAALSCFSAEGMRPMSILPWHFTGSLTEDLSLFFNLMMAAGVLGRQSLTGQSLFVKRSDYQAVGGHASVRNQVLENLFMADLFSEQGIIPHSLAGKNILSMQMYPDGLSQLIQGWSKPFARGTRRVSRKKLFLSSIWISGAWFSWLAPLLSLILAPAITPWLALAYLFYVIQLFWLARFVGRFRWPVILLYPVALIFFQFVFSSSAWHLKRGKAMQWRGRDVPA